MSKGKRNQPEEPPQPGATRISPAEVQEREFRLAFRGYNERDVDVFLDEITEELSRLLGENRRLREQLEGKGPVAADPDHALLEADAIVLRAHEEAALILADAQRQAVAAEGTEADAAVALDAEGLAHPAVPIVSTFIARERGFLQNMAALIQRHAEEVKQDIRRAKDAGLTAGLDRPADVASSVVVAPITEAAVEGEVAEPVAEEGPAASAVDAEWAPEPAAADEGGSAPDGADAEEDDEAPSWEAVAEAAWGASAASSWPPSEGPDGGAEVEPEDGVAEPEASVVAGAAAREALSKHLGDDHQQASARGIGVAGQPVATELERPDLGAAPVGLMAGERAVGVEGAPPLVHAAVRLGDAHAVGVESRDEDEPPTLQELFWGES
jgi:DivIVA domain-containing protein